MPRTPLAASSSARRAARLPILRRSLGALALMTLTLGSCAHDAQTVRMGPYREIVQPLPPARPAASAYPPASAYPALSQTGGGEAPSALVSVVRQLGASFAGDVGISVRRVDRNWEVGWNSDRLMPQQSVSKLWVALTVLDGVDRGRITLEEPVTIRPGDLTLFHQPIASLVGTEGYTTTVSDLLNRALTQSDNTANDALLRRAGGPEAVRGYLARRFIANIRFGPGERLLQSTTAGLSWDQSLSRGRSFYAARDKLPLSVRQRALDTYLANPPDGAAASAITLALARLKRGEMLAPSSTAYVLSTMHDAKTGPQRIKGGVPIGWSYAHKTGTGQVLGARTTGFNDVGIITAPDGASYAVAVMIGSTTATIQQRFELMQAVSRAVAANHQR